MTPHRLPAAVAICAALALVTHQAGTPDARQEMGAVPGGEPFADGDMDMVPDCIESLMYTDPNCADTDSDGIDDFEEILTYRSHLATAPPAPVDHGIRVLVTSSQSASGASDVWLHMMLRFVGTSLSCVGCLDLYADREGKYYSLLPLLGHGEIRVNSRQRARDGTSFIFSIRLSSERELYSILPCTLGASVLIGGKRINRGTFLMPSGADISALLPYSETSLSLQPVNGQIMFQDGNPFYRGGGRVCLVSVSRIGTSSTGRSLCEVDRAECKAAAGFRCSSNCSQQVGQLIVIPDGLTTITGGGD